MPNVVSFATSIDVLPMEKNHVLNQSVKPCRLFDVPGTQAFMPIGKERIKIQIITLEVEK